MATTFRTIAKYERKILMRSWFFRIFSALSLFVLFVFNMEEISEVGNMGWAYRAVPSNMPYANIFLLNIAQAFIAVFLSSEFIKRERKQDTTEVFYVRSMSNATYLLGKAWSILSIFLLINLAALLMALIFNLLALNTSVDWQAYLYYPLLLSLPTLLFIIGLSTLIMSILRNQALTFVLVLGYIFSSLIYLKSTYHYLFDFMAFHLPMFHSEIVGFGDWPTILNLRGMYACFGLGFLFFSVLLINRLTQSRWMNILSLLLGLVFTVFALSLGYRHIVHYQKTTALPQQIVALNNQYLDHPRIDIEAHDISLAQGRDRFAAASQIRGRTVTAAREFVFTLNPGLKVSAVTSGGQPLTYHRQLHLLFISLDSLLSAGAPLEMTIEYGGKIEESACYPDVGRDLKYAKPNNFLFDTGKRYAFLHPEFLLLTPENQWYPQAGVGYSDESPLWYRKDFIDYRLTVKTLAGLRPVSQGHPRPTGENTFLFEPKHALPQLSLSIGKYRKDSLQTEDLTFSVYYIEGHDYFKTAFPDIRDTLPAIIRERVGDFERRSGLKYPLKEFSIVEVPGQFKTYDRIWTSAHQTNQPGLVYMPERGMYSRDLDFIGSVKRRSRWSQNRNRSPEEMQIEVLNRFLEEFFRFKEVNTSSNNGRTVVEESINPYYQFAQLYELCNNLDSEQWPVLNRVLESYLRRENEDGGDWARRSSGSTQNELANMILQEKSFAEVLTLSENKPLIDNVIELKGEMLFSLVQAKTEGNRFREFITGLVQEKRFHNFKFETFEARLQAEFGVDLSRYMSEWFNETEMPRYLISPPVAEEVLAGNREMTRIRFIVSNLGNAEGVIKSTFRPEGSEDKILYLEAGQTVQVAYLSVSEPSGIRFNTLVSGNLPSQIEYVFEEISSTTVTNARERRVVANRPVVPENEREIIVDNEDPYFEFSQYEETSRLRQWLRPNEEEDFKYKGTRVWRAPLNWTATTDDRFFGEFIRSAFYIKAGDGSKAAKWKVPISEPGRYGVFYHVYKDDSFNWDRDQKGIYRFTIPHENGTDHPTIELSHQTPGGWTSLGDYVFLSDTITITLSNESRLRAVFADAIKLVKMD